MTIKRYRYHLLCPRIVKHLRQLDMLGRTSIEVSTGIYIKINGIIVQYKETPRSENYTARKVRNFSRWRKEGWLGCISDGRTDFLPASPFGSYDFSRPLYASRPSRQPPNDIRWRAWEESNPHLRFWRPSCYHYFTTDSILSCPTISRLGTGDGSLKSFQKTTCSSLAPVFPQPIVPTNTPSE